MTIEEKAKEYQERKHPKLNGLVGALQIRNAFKEGVKEATRWIPVEEGLPEFDSRVIVKFKLNDLDSSFSVADYVNESICCHNNIRIPRWYVYPSGGHILTSVTHWRPIELE